MQAMTTDEGAQQAALPQEQRALRNIRRNILSMDFAPGEPVSERSLQDRYGMSRTPIRAALATLVAEGLVQRASRGSYIVAPIDLQEIRDLFEYREELEAVSVRLACRGLDPGALATLRQTVDRGRTDFRAEDWLASGLDVHVELAGLSGNPFLRDAVRSAVGRALRLRWLLASDPEQRDTAWQEHTRVLDLIEGGNADAAEREIRAHTRHVRDQILDAVGRARSVLGTRSVVDGAAARPRG